jgi:hypothetical protein
MSRKLGKTQAAFLEAMLQHYGSWHANCGWYWGSSSATRRLCESLEKRGLLRSEDIKARRDVIQLWRVIDQDAARKEIARAKGNPS